MKVMKWRNASPCIRRIYRSRRGNGDYVDYKTWHMGVSSSDPWSGLSRNVECTVENESEREKNVIGSSVTVTPLMNFESTQIVHRLDTHFVISAMTVAPSWPFWLRWQIPQQSGFGFSMHEKKLIGRVFRVATIRIATNDKENGKNGLSVHLTLRAQHAQI